MKPKYQHSGGHHTGKKKTCAHPECDWAVHTGICCGQHKDYEKWYNKIKKEKKSKTI